MNSVSFDVATAPLETGITQLEASAGTGKTYALTGLCLRLIAEADVEIGRILITTFTKAATAELRDRVRALLRAAVAMFDDGPGDHEMLRTLHPRYVENAAEYRPRLERALRQFDDAVIVTIHGFCLRQLEERAFESGLPFDAEATEDEGEILREVAEDFWRQRIYPAGLRLGGFAAQEALDSAKLVPLLRSCVARPDMTILPEHDANSFPLAEGNLLAAFADVEKEWRNDAAGVREIFAHADRWGNSRVKDAEAIAARIRSLELCLADPASCRDDYDAVDFFAAENIANQKDGRKKQPAPQHPFFDACSTFVRTRQQWALSFRREFLAWAPAELGRRKLQRNLLSFGDVLTRLRDALRGPQGAELLAAARERFTAALVDEFQDTDPVQAEIFRRLFEGHGRLYLIGDPKQAIYGFRGADVFTYLEAGTIAQQRHQLAANQRSVTPLVQAVNAVFQRNPDAFLLPGIRFHPALAAGRENPNALHRDGTPEPPMRVWAWSEDEPVTAERAKALLPTVVADTIVAQLHDGTQTDDRSLKPSDFAVLVLKNDEADLVKDALVAAGLPAVTLSRKNVFASAEAAEMHALVGALVNPTSETAVRAALATTALGFNAAEIAALADARWEAILDAFLRRHLRWQTDGFFPAFRELLVEEKVRPRLLALTDGERRLTNFLHLAELLHRAAAAERLGPAALLRWLAIRMHLAEGGEDQELRLESDEDAVKVVTVHRSKGLEFGIVWHPFAWSHAEVRKTAATTFHDPQTGGVVLDLGSPDESAHRARMAHEELAEDLRLFYVALTRAKWQCHFVCGRFNKVKNSAASWLLHPPGGAPEDAVTTLQARELDDATVRRDLSTLAAQAPGAIEVADVPEPQQRRWQPAAASHPPRNARVFRGNIRRDFGIGSFSSLIANAPEEEHDYDRDTAPAEPEPAATGIHAFPRGRRAGTCLHEIFERLDFTDDSAIDGIVQRKLEVFGFSRADFRTAVAANVRAVLEVELTRGLRLKNVTPAQRLNELEFHLPIGRLDPAGIARVLGETLSFPALEGFLKGFIDLIFEHEGRYYLADWKSNWLGSAAADYSAEAMAAEMRRHHYGVQYHLYTVALHRYLAQRLPGYDYEEHFGGVFYLFLRGIDPARPELGIFRERPTRKRIDDLDALFS